MARVLNSSHKHWRKSSDEKLRAMWKLYSRADLLKTFSGRSWSSIQCRAQELGLRRIKTFKGASSETKGALMASLRSARERNGLTAAGVARMIDKSPRFVAQCERGAAIPSMPMLDRWCAALGLELSVRPIQQIQRLAA